MAMTIGFSTVQEYLSAYAKSGSIGNSPHRAFWKSKIVGGAAVPITYDDFINGFVPIVKYHGAPIPILWKDAPLLSPFFQILSEPGGFAGFDQMIPGGPHLGDDGVTVTLTDGTVVQGAKVLSDLETWLSHGFPEQPTAIT
jgi:hypothetical protein